MVGTVFVKSDHKKNNDEETPTNLASAGRTRSQGFPKGGKRFSGHLQAQVIHGCRVPAHQQAVFTVRLDIVGSILMRLAGQDIANDQLPTPGPAAGHSSR